MAIKRTGVELVAEGEAEFVAALKRADGSVVTFGRSVKKNVRRCLDLIWKEL